MDSPNPPAVVAGATAGAAPQGNPRPSDERRIRRIGSDDGAVRRVPGPAGAAGSWRTSHPMCALRTPSTGCEVGRRGAKSWRAGRMAELGGGHAGRSGHDRRAPGLPGNPRPPDAAPPDAWLRRTAHSSHRFRRQCRRKRGTGRSGGADLPGTPRLSRALDGLSKLSGPGSSIEVGPWQT